jgi:phage shock protein B
MLNVIIVSIVFGSIVALAALICGTVLIIIKARSRNNTRGAADSEEAKTIQEIYRGLDRLEERIDSLETILADSAKRKESNE